MKNFDQKASSLHAFMVRFCKTSALVLVCMMPAVAAGCARRAAPVPETPVALLGSPQGSPTGRDDLVRTVASMEQRLEARPADAGAAVALADAWLRQTRVTGNAGLAMRAEQVLQRALAHDPNHYQARRMLATVLLSQHRFREAIAAAERCRQVRPDDAWPLGVIGDAHLELGDYERAFDALDRMLATRPEAAAYGRASYARELQGDLEGAVRLMKMALEATSPRDVESVAWHHAQLGQLHLAADRLVEARREFEHAEFLFSGHPLAGEGLARVALASDDAARALELVNQRLAASPSPAELALAGDILTKLGRATEAERQYRLAEAAWRSDAPEPARLAVFLADRGWKIDEAVRLAEGTAAERRDIYTDDALAWVYFKSGQMDKAVAASARAQRTGSRDRTIREHAAAISRAAAGKATAQ